MNSQERTAILLKDCEIGMTDESFCVHAFTPETGRALKGLCDWLALQALTLGKLETRLTFPGHPTWVIPAKWATTPSEGENANKDKGGMFDPPSCWQPPTCSIQQPVESSDKMQIVTPELIQSVYTSSTMPISRELLKVMERMIESDRPQFLLCNHTDQQLWLNQLACNMIESAGDEAVKRCMRNYWNASDLELLHQRLEDTSLPFDHSYRAILNDTQSDTWFEAVSSYESVESNGRSLRLSTNRDFKILGQQSELAPMLSR